MCTTFAKNGLLDGCACLREGGSESLCHVARLVLHKLPESGGNVRLRDVDVIPGGNGRRAMPHEAGQCETVHAGLCGAGSEGVPPAIELERLQTSGLYRGLVRVLQGCDVPGNSRTGKHKGRILCLCRSFAPLKNLCRPWSERKAALCAVRLALANVKHSSR